MSVKRTPSVSVLLATYNGSSFVGAQIRSLRDNSTAFILDWLDDHSTDDTREVVRAAAARAGVPLREWHQPQHLGVPATFFTLLESVEADIYMFCDQDDIWQPGKIDSAVENLRPDLEIPALCFSDPLMFYEDRPGVTVKMSDFHKIKTPEALEPSRALMVCPAAGQSIGLTKPLRDLYMRHRTIAREHAVEHSSWMYLIAVSSGTYRMLVNAPTTLYRRHSNNVTARYYERRGNMLGRLLATWKLQHALRRNMAKQAIGFVNAAHTLNVSPQLDRLVELGKIVSTMERRQSLLTLFRLARQRAMWPDWRHATWLSVSCLLSRAERSR